MKHLLIAVCLLTLASCGTPSCYDYEPELGDYCLMVYGTVTDKDDWIETVSISKTVHYYAIILDDISNDNSYHILVAKANYDSLTVGDEIGIPYCGNI